MAIAIALPPASSGVDASSNRVARRANAAGQVVLAWDASPSEPDISQYLVGYRTAVGAETVVGVGKVLTFTVGGLTPGQTYFFRAYSENSGGRSLPSNEVSESLPGDTPDTVAPSAPTNVTGTAASISQVNLQWSASTDNVAVTAYRITRNTQVIGEVPASQTTFSDVGLAAATAYSYTVAAKDAAGNVSSESAAALVTTLGDTTAPSSPGSLAGVPTTSTIALTWAASSDNVGVVGYRVARNGQALTVTNAVTYTDGGLAPGTAYTYTVVAIDAANNVSAPASLTLSTLAQPAPCVANGKPYSITIAVQSWTKQLGPGARGRVDFTLANSFAVTLVQVKLGTQVVGELGPAGDLRDLGAQFFSVPRTLGTYNLTVTARDSAGCVTSTTAARPVVVQ